MLSIGIYYFIGINLFSFIIMGYDKRMAKQRKRRIPERHLFFYGFIGGALGTLVAMRMFRHKTQHASFQFGIPVLILVNLAMIFFIRKYFD
jgi:uncharacterized membrane protein YsdA (DUF1294 family)